MVFNSNLFLFYFLPVLLIIYYLINRKFKNWFLLLVSLFFYAWGAPEFVFVLIASVVVDFFVIRRCQLRKEKLPEQCSGYPLP
jgi:hypothetical protein